MTITTSTRGAIRSIDLAWGLFTLTMLVTMLISPAKQTIPYHLIFVSFTLLYGYRLWSPPVTLALLALLVLIPGLMFLRVYATGAVALDELAEIPLMPLIVGGMAWHAHRSAAARRRVEQLARVESSWLTRQREFLRDTAHAIRTPVTIARGHIELVQMGFTDPQLQSDTNEVLHQLDRMRDLARRLLEIEALRMPDLVNHERLDLAALVTQSGQRWSAAAARCWLVEADPGQHVMIDKLRLESALDALVENALRFTQPGDTIRISCRADAAAVWLEVADSGPGIPGPDRDHVFDRFFHRHPPGEEPGTGLGLALVAAVAEAFGGSVRAGESAEGGAVVGLRLPRI